MAITLRTNEDQDKALNDFMSKQSHATKNKAVLWLIENAGRLCENDKTLSEIVKAERQLDEAKEKLKKVKSPNLNEYLY